MTRDFEEGLDALMSEKAGLLAPAALRVRVSAVPDEYSQGTHRPGLGVTVRAMAVGSIALIAVIVLASVWLRYRTTSVSGDIPSTAASAAPTSLMIDTMGTSTATYPWEGEICMEARAGPMRVSRAGSAMVFVPTTNYLSQRIVWPQGYSARVVDGVAQLLSPAREIVAREGDILELGGGLGPDGAFHVCSFSIVRP